MRSLVLSLAVLAISGCAGELSMERLSLSANPGNDTRFTTKGVIVYLPRLVKATYALTEYKNEKGEITGKCSPVVFDKLDIVPDTSRPYAVMYRPELLSTHKFSVSMANGMITTVNTESESAFAKTLETLASAAAKAAPIAGGAAVAAAPNGTPECNTAQQLKAVKAIQVDE